MRVHRGEGCTLDCCFLCESGQQVRSEMNLDEQWDGKEPPFAFRSTVFTEVVTRSLTALSLRFSKSGCGHQRTCHSTLKPLVVWNRSIAGITSGK